MVNPMVKTPLQVKLEALVIALNRLEDLTPAGEARQMLQSARSLAAELSAAAQSDEEPDRLAALFHVSRVLGTSLDLDQVLNQVMDAVIGLTGAERGFLVLLEADAGDWRLRAARNYSQETLKPKDMEVSRTVIESVLSSGEGVITTDARSDPRFSDQESVTLYALRSILCAPLLLHGRAIGAIYVDNRAQAGLFGLDDLEMLNAFATQAAMALENARLYTRTDRLLAERVAELETLAQVDRELNTSLDLNRVIETVRKWAIQVGQAAEVWVLLNTGEPRLGDDDERSGLNAGDLRAFPSDPPVPDIELVNRAIQEASLQHSDGEPPVRLAFPLQQGGRTRGAVLVERPQPFSEVEIEFLGHLCGRAAAAFENARLYLAVQSANQAKTKFVSVVTHELRIPMTSIKGYSDLLRQGAVGPVNEMQTNFLGVIRNNVDRMSALVSDLSDISRIETGRLKIDLKPLSMAAHVEEVLGSLQPRLDEKKQILELEVPDDLPKVYADPNRVVQVLTNLLSNAWKYTPESGCIRLTAAPGAGSVRVMVTDTGIGISPEDQDKLFSQFFRSEDPLVREQQGWGLGLNVARRLVEVMGGEIGCESALGQGSTFWFTLPILQDG